MKLILSLAIAVFILAAPAAARSWPSPPSPPSPPSSVYRPPAWGKTPVYDKFTVGAGGYWHMPFQMEDKGNYSGKFESSGGNIEMMIVDEANYENFANGFQYKGFYFSGSLKVHTFHIRLAKGSYRLIFNNKPNIWLARTVYLTLNR